MENSLTIVIPVYNEEESLKLLLPKLTDFCRTNSFQLILVNDGSVDNSRVVLESFCKGCDFARVISHKVNKGYGGAIKTGIDSSKTKYVITIDADGQHSLEDVAKLHKLITEKDADMIVGSRKGQSGLYRRLGKSLIRFIAKMLMPLKIRDINSGMKIYNTELAKKYISFCPDSMAYSDIILLTFVNQRYLVIEEPIITKRVAGKSTISLRTALETIIEIINIVMLFNPMRIFFPIALINILFGIIWGLPFMIMGHGISNGAIITIITGLLFFALGLIAEQLSMLRKEKLK